LAGPDTVREPESSKTVSGEIVLESKAAANVISLNTEPARKLSRTAGFPQSSSGDWEYWFGSRDGTLANARMPPVCGSMTIIVPDSAP